MPVLDAGGQLLRRLSSTRLGGALAEHEPIVYEESGSRATSGQDLLERLEGLLPALGITRVANISMAAGDEFPVFQSTRPNLHARPPTGHNTCSQGKGSTELQAKLSCLMESVEVLCAEPREAELIRGSYRELEGVWPIADPRLFLGMFEAPRVDPAEPLVWEQAYHVQSMQLVLIPAQLVYFPLQTSDYSTRRCFASTSNGLASGATYLEAVVHGLYEVIERHYIALAQLGLGSRHALNPAGLTTFDLDRFNDEHEGHQEISLFVDLQPSLGRNLPFVECRLGGGLSVRGHGCSSRLDLSVERAISECFQGHATICSGAGESHSAQSRPQLSDRWTRSIPTGAPASIDDLAPSIIDRSFSTLAEEFDFIVGWLSSAGFQTVYVANLTRAGIEIPVVRVVVPGLLLPIGYRFSGGYPEPLARDCLKAAFPNIEGALS